MKKKRFRINTNIFIWNVIESRSRSVQTERSVSYFMPTANDDGHRKLDKIQRKKNKNPQKRKYVPTLIETDLFLDTNTVAYSPFVVVDAIAVVLDAAAFAVAYGRPNVVAVFDPTALELVD